MENTIQNSGRFLFSIFVISISLVSISFLNLTYKTDFLKKIDIINKLVLNETVHDITDLFNQELELRTKTKYIVIHNDAIEQTKLTYAPVFAIKKYHKLTKNWQSFAYHFYITEEGKTYKAHSPDFKTIHVGTKFNEVSLAVCLSGDFDKEKPSPNQLIALLKLLRELEQEFPKAEIVGHRDLDKTTSCPGKNMNVKAIINQVNNFHFLELWNN